MVAPVPMLTPADSARTVGAVYTVSLLAVLPVATAAASAFALRRARAEGRVLVWRAAIVLLLSMVVVRPFLSHSMAWVVPAALATPLVALGRVQMMTSWISSASDQVAAAGALSTVEMLLVLYLGGVMLVLLPTAVVIARMRRIAARAREPDARSGRALEQARERLGVRRRVRVLVSHEVAVPMTWGVWRPVIVCPASTVKWSDDELRIALLHELTHVARNDWLFAIVARVACALYWFHPGVWYVARRLRGDCELACDDSVLAAGVRASDYAALLLRAAQSLARTERPAAALALSRRCGLRARLQSIVDVSRSTAPIGRAWRRAAATLTVALVWPMSAIQLAPTRDVLTRLMRDASWEVRAYAVLGLAQRPDTVAVARKAAELDPSPRVRAWARYALGERPRPVTFDELVERP
ncbi:MAG TPA: M56 family metallopeptidase [Gemmatimonadaceae bacterium]|nr:M56 family metallopeptidase [Gemmatimonadaceae bacterium]